MEIRKINRAISNHWVAIKLTRRLDTSDPGDLQDELCGESGGIDEFPNTETQLGQFGTSDAHGPAKMGFATSGKGVPLSRGTDNDRSANTKNWNTSAQQEWGKGERGNLRSANVTNGEEEPAW